MDNKKKIIQINLNLLKGDGITHYIESTHRLLKKCGIQTTLYAHYIEDECISDAIQVETLKEININENDIIMYHMSIGCSFNSEVLDFPNKKILVYHNITPYTFMSKWSSLFENDLRAGAFDFRRTVGKYDRCITFSEFSKQNLIDIGWSKDLIDVIPYFNYFQDMEVASDPEILKEYEDDSYINVLFVGRVVPNKRQDLLINAIHYYRNVYQKKIRLILVGNTEFAPYFRYLKDFVKKFNVPDIIFTSGVTKSQLKAYYEIADIFLCLSEHEGFCMPIVEAMHMKVPVIAYDSSAIGYTMGGAGMLLDSNDPITVSSTMRKLLTDNNLKNSIIVAQTKRLEELDNSITEKKLLEFLSLYVQIQNDEPATIDTSQNKKIAFVVQRYGEEINGGAEMECRMFAEHLKHYYDIEVLTSCVDDYDTDINVYDEGVTDDEGIIIRRFKAVKQRDPVRFDELGNGINERSEAEVLEWIDEVGPCCPGLIEYLSQHGSEYRIIIFVTYVFYTSIKGLMLNLDNAVFFPTAHDEGLIYIDLYKKCFEQARGFIYNTVEEKQLVDRLFNTNDKPYSVTGIGIDIPEEMINTNVQEKYNLPDNYMVYAGRISDAKGCNILLEYFSEYKRRNDNDLQLIMIGKFDYGFYAKVDPNIHYLGFVSEEDKNGIISNAKALILPSKNESLSLVILESMYFGRPVIVNGACSVLTAHCRNSNAGLYYNTYFEFEQYINFLLNNNKVYKKMCNAGIEYVKKNYTWETVTKKLIDYIETNF